MQDRNIAHLDPRLQPLCNQFLVQCLAEGINAFVTETYRSNAYQDADYAQGRTAPGHIITNARAGQSPHNSVDVNGNPAARAFDFGIKTEEGSLDWNGSDAQWLRAVDIGEALGMVSGQTFPGHLLDEPHMEMADWKNVSTYDPASATLQTANTQT